MKYRILSFLFCCFTAVSFPLVPDHKNFHENLRPDFFDRQGAEGDGNLHQVVEPERKADQKKMGQIPENFVNRVLGATTGVSIGVQAGDEDEDDDDGYYSYNVWYGPGWYNGVWFSTEVDFDNWNHDHYHSHHHHNGGGSGHHGHGGDGHHGGDHHGGGGGGHGGGHH